MVDERLRKFERAARGGDPLLEARALRDRLRAGLLSAERLELLAHLRHEAARLALGLPEPKPIETPEESAAWWSALARHGRETAVRAAIALARPHLLASLWGHDRFAGVPEEAWSAIESIEDWIREPTDARLAALQTAVTAAVEAPEPAGGIGLLVSIVSLITATTLEEFLSGFGESAFHSRDGEGVLVARVRQDLVPWILGERDPVKTRDLEEGRHFGVDADISRSVSFSPDGRFVLSSSRAGTVTIRDAATGTIVRDFPRVRGEVFAAAFSPDGTKVFAAGYWSPSRLLDVATGVEVRTFPQEEGVQDVAFVDDGRVLTAGSDDKAGRLLLWDLATGRMLRALEGHTRMVRTVVVAPGGRAVSASSDDTIRVWDIERGVELASWPQPASVDSLVLAPSGTEVLAGLSDGRMRLLDIESGAEVKTLTAERGSVYGLAFVPPGSTVVSVIGSRGTRITQWDLATGEPIRHWDAFHAITFHVAVAPDGKRFVTGDREGGLRVYGLA